MNGDGLPDRVDHHYQGTNGIHVAINNGNGFNTPSLWLPVGTFGTELEHWPILSNGQGSTIATLLDMNGDGRPDRVDHHYQGTFGIHVAINNGNGFNSPTLWLPVGTFGTDWGKFSDMEHWARQYNCNITGYEWRRSARSC